jgi:hypothetical protein
MQALWYMLCIETVYLIVCDFSAVARCFGRGLGFGRVTLSESPDPHPNNSPLPTIRTPGNHPNYAYRSLLLLQIIL